MSPAPGGGRGWTKPRGRCARGAVRFAFDPAAVISQHHCHCEACRRATGAPVTSWLQLRDTGWRWVVGRPRLHASSPGVQRGSCGACGGPLSYATDRRPGETDLLAAALVDPTEFAPRAHYHWAERLPWLRVSDDLPKHARGDG